MPKLLLPLVAALVTLALACTTAPVDGPTPGVGSPTATPTDGTAEPTDGPGGAGGELGRGTAVPAPSASPQPVPSGWSTFTGPDSAFTFRYPAEWHALPEGGLYSWDPATWDKPYFPPDGIRVDAIYAQLDQAEPRPPEATDFTMNSYKGWEVVYQYKPPTPTGVTQVHQVAIEAGQFRLSLIAYFAQTTPDENVFSQVLSSLSLAK